MEENLVDVVKETDEKLQPTTGEYSQSLHFRFVGIILVASYYNIHHTVKINAAEFSLKVK